MCLKRKINSALSTININPKTNKMRATILNKLITKIKNIIMMIRLHRRFSVKAIPVRIEQKMLIPDGYRRKF
jgi:hypothetical protein